MHTCAFGFWMEAGAKRPFWLGTGWKLSGLWGKPKIYVGFVWSTVASVLSPATDLFTNTNQSAPLTTHIVKSCAKYWRFRATSSLWACVIPKHVIPYQITLLLGINKQHQAPFQLHTAFCPLPRGPTLTSSDSPSKPLVFRRGSVFHDGRYCMTERKAMTEASKEPTKQAARPFFIIKKNQIFQWTEPCQLCDQNSSMDSACWLRLYSFSGRHVPRRTWPKRQSTWKAGTARSTSGLVTCNSVRKSTAMALAASNFSLSLPDDPRDSMDVSCHCFSGVAYVSCHCCFSGVASSWPSELSRPNISKSMHGPSSLSAGTGSFTHDDACSIYVNWLPFKRILNHSAVWGLCRLPSLQYVDIL